MNDVVVDALIYDSSKISLINLNSIRTIASLFVVSLGVTWIHSSYKIVSWLYVGDIYARVLLEQKISLCIVSSQNVSYQLWTN